MNRKNAVQWNRFGALTLALAMALSLMTGCSNTVGTSSASQSGGDTSTTSSSDTSTEATLPELTTDTYGNAAVGYQAAVVSANEYTSQVGMDIL